MDWPALTVYNSIAVYDNALRWGGRKGVLQPDVCCITVFPFY